MGFGWRHNSRRVSLSDRPASPDRDCAGWACRASRRPPRERHRPSRPGLELRARREGLVAGRRHGSRLASGLRARRPVEGLSSSHLTDEQAIALGDWIDAHCPRSTRKIGAWLKRSFGLSYSRSGLIALLHRLDFDYRKPEAMPRGLDDAKQQAFIDEYENLLNTMGADEAVAFVDAVHPTHQVRPAGCWARKDLALAVEQTTGRDRLNIHGAINLETGQTQNSRGREGQRAELHQAIGRDRGHAYRDAPHPRLCRQRQLSSCRHRQGVACAAGRKIVLHFLPPYCPHLDPIERLWALMHENVTHNRDYKTFAEFKREIITFFGTKCPEVEALLRPNHGQFPRHSSRRFSGYRLAGVSHLLKHLRCHAVMFSSFTTKIDGNLKEQQIGNRIHVSTEKGAWL